MYSKAVILCSVITLAACSITSEIVYEDGEGPLPENFFRELNDNNTQTDWVMAHLGKPHNTQTLGDNSSLYTWHFSRLNQHEISFLLVLNYTAQQNQNEYLHLVSQNGIVKKHWMDERAEIREDILEELRESVVVADL